MTALDSTPHSNVDILLARNEQIATGATTPIAGERLRGVTIVSCVDPRVDPAHILGVQASEAPVLRVLGGRVTPGLIESLELLGHVGRVMGAPAGVGELVLVHHSDCGLSHLGPEDSAMLAGYLGVDENALEGRYVGDPIASLEVDLEVLGSSGLNRALRVSGLFYDVDTERASLTVGPTEIGGP